MRYITLPTILILTVIILGFTTSSNNSTAVPSSDTTKSALSLYGEYIFYRENCIRCHSLQINADATKISLDGEGGKYGETWHYLHFKSPEDIVPESKMTEFPSLFTTNIDRKILFKLLRNNNRIQSQKDSIREDLNVNKEVVAITNLINTENVFLSSSNPKEIIALIAFIQQIPASAAKRYQDSIQTMEIKRRMDNLEAKWNTQLSNENSDIFKCAKSTNKDTIAMGKAIFQTVCSICHGMEGGGSVGPNLTDDYWLYGSSINSLIKTIKDGKPERGMKSWKEDYEPEEVGKLIAYIKSLKGTNPKFGKEHQGKKE